MRFASACLASAAFAALAALVAAGALAGLDQWSVDHLMPGSMPRSGEAGLAEALIPLYGTHWGNAYSVAANVVTLPASFFVALALVVRRSRGLAFLLVAATAVEALCKEVVVRPPLYAGPVHVSGLDSSFPSGHTLRTVLVAAAYAHPLAGAWAVASIVTLQLAGWHTPTDVAGGLLLGGLALLGARALRRGRLARGARR